VRLMDEWCVVLPDGCVLQPFASVEHQVELGEAASILRYFDRVTALLRADAEGDLRYL
jgi:hypothetical protein